MYVVNKPQVPPMQHIQQQSNKVFFQNNAPLSQPSIPCDQIMGSMPSKKRNLQVANKYSGDREDQLSQDIQTLIPESNLFAKLVAFEKKMDIALKKRQLTLQENLPNNHRKNSVTKILKMCVYSVNENTGGFYHIDESLNAEIKDEPSFALRIEGRIVDESLRSRKFSSFFKRVFVQFDKDEFPHNWSVEWLKTNTVDHVDGFEIKRKCKHDTMAHIFLEIDHCPEKYKPSQPLSDLLELNTREITKTNVILNLWNYIRHHKLHDPNKRSCVLCNEPLFKVFGVQKMEYSDIPKLVHAHLSPPDPIQIAFPIKLGNGGMENEMWFEIPVEVETSSYQIPLNEHKQAIDQYDADIHEKIKRINEKKRKRDFFMSFAKDPMNFLDDFVSSQIRDYKIAINHQNRDPDFERQTEFFLQPLAKEATKKYLAGRPTRYPQDVPVSQTKPEI